MNVNLDESTQRVNRRVNSHVNIKNNWPEPTSHRDQLLYSQTKYIFYNVSLRKHVANHSPHEGSLFKKTPLYLRLHNVVAVVKPDAQNQ